MPSETTVPVYVSVPSTVPSAGNSTPSVVSNRPTMHPASSHTHLQYSVSESINSHNTSSGGYSMMIHTTSSASPVFIGGGGGGGSVRNSASIHKAENIHHSYSVSMPSLAYASGMATTSSMVESSQQRLSKHNLNAENTLASMQSVIDQNTPNAAPARAKKGNWDGYGQDEEPFPDPIGDVPWIIMLLLTIGWCVRLRLKKR